VSVLEGRVLPLLFQHRECVVNVEGNITTWAKQGKVCDGLQVGQFVSAALCTCTTGCRFGRCAACEWFGKSGNALILWKL
jgi:hypothetical protein